MSNLTLKHNPKSYEAAEAALGNRSSLTIGHNTKLVREDGTIFATYHDNRIVEYAPDGVHATWAGWATTTTANRLNKLTDGSFNIRQREPHMNGKPVGYREWLKVS